MLQADEEPPPPQAMMPPARATRRSSEPSIVRNLRRCGAMPKRNRQARTAPLPAYQGIPCGVWFAAVHEDWLAVVETVSVAGTAVSEVMLTGLVAPKLSVGGCCAPVGLAVMDADSATEPVKPLAGDTVMVEVSPVVAPAVTVTAVPATAKLGGGAAVTVTVPDPVAAL